jgi:hypothetical protein
MQRFTSINLNGSLTNNSSFGVFYTFKWGYSLISVLLESWSYYANRKVLIFQIPISFLSNWVRHLFLPYKLTIA